MTAETSKIPTTRAELNDEDRAFLREIDALVEAVPENKREAFLHFLVEVCRAYVKMIESFDQEAEAKALESRAA